VEKAKVRRETKILRRKSYLARYDLERAQRRLVEAQEALDKATKQMKVVRKRP